MQHVCLYYSSYVTLLTPSLAFTKHTPFYLREVAYLYRIVLGLISNNSQHAELFFKEIYTAARLYLCKRQFFKIN